MEKEYSPSMWSKRFNTAAEVLDYHVKFVTEESEKTRKKYNCRIDICYGKGRGEKMDIYYKEKEEGSPIFVYIHGGFWQELDKNQSAYCVTPIIEQGHRVIVVDYDLCPEVSVSQITEEIIRAATAIYEYAENTSASAISFCGHSVGAHLIACLLRDSRMVNPLVKSVFLISGVYDLTELWNTQAVNANNILAVDASNAEQLSPLFSNYKHLLEMDVKIHLYVAKNDSPTFIKQSKQFYSHLQNFDLIPKLEILDDLDHFDIVENLSNDKFVITQNILEELNEFKSKER